MTSVMSVVMLLIQLSSGIGGCLATIALATRLRRCGSVISYLRSVVFKGSLMLSFFLLFDANLRRMRTCAYTRLWSD